MTKASGIMPGVFLTFEEVLHYGPEEPKKNAPGATAQGMSELDSSSIKGTSQLGRCMIETLMTKFQGVCRWGSGWDVLA